MKRIAAIRYFQPYLCFNTNANQRPRTSTLLLKSKRGANLNLCKQELKWLIKARTDACKRQFQRVNAIKQSPVGTATPDPISKPLQLPATGQEAPAKSTTSRPGTTYPAIKISKIDVEARPMYEPNGKSITEVDMDAG